MLKVVWRFNLAPGVDEDAFFAWLREHVWSSSAPFGCATYAYRLQGGKHRYATEAHWPSDAARQAWTRSESFRAIPFFPDTDSLWGAQVDMEGTVYEPVTPASGGGLYDGLPWGDLVRFQTSGPAGNDGLEGLAPEEQYLDLAAFLAKDAGYFASRAQQYFHQARQRPWGGNVPREQLERELRRSLAWFLGHTIMAAKYLEADLLQEFADWSAEIGMHLPKVPHHPLPLK